MTLIAPVEIKIKEPGVYWEDTPVLVTIDLGVVQDVLLEMARTSEEYLADQEMATREERGLTPAGLMVPTDELAEAIASGIAEAYGIEVRWNFVGSYQGHYTRGR